MKVDLPEPEGPITATNSPLSMSTLTLSQRVDFAVPHAVDLYQLPRVDEHQKKRARGSPPPAAGCEARASAVPMITSSFSLRPLMHFGAHAVAQPQAHVERFRLAVLQHVHPAGGRLAAPAGLGQQPLPRGALLRGQDLGDARIGLGADPFGLAPAGGVA